jgi:hydroxymethylglutaryl-CoA synthase
MGPRSTHQTAVGIDDLAAYIPKLYLPIETLATQRQLEYIKLNKGLGLSAMAFPDAHEDVATMAANAILELLLRNGIAPQRVGRIYIGTESSLDGAKPMASYVIDMLSQYFSEQYGPDCFLNCDVVDMTFACIGAVDALQNTLDWVRGGDDRIGIVAGSDIAKYELGSTGEYTQGAGSIAMLIKPEPRLLAIHDTWGVASRSVHDFYKPLRRVSKTALVEEVLRLAGSDLSAEAILGRLNGALEAQGVLDSQEHEITLHRETPVFDGPYSNLCYQNRIWEALRHYAAEMGLSDSSTITDDWHRLVFHLPYAYQARRMFAEIFMIESQRRGDWPELERELGMERPQPGAFESEKAYGKAYGEYLRAITKTGRYRNFVKEKIEKGERASSVVGNLYTSSILLALMSTLEADLEEGKELAGTALGFFAYGSGSKSKVFTATVQEGWQDIVGRFQLMASLAQRQAIDYETYEQLHRGLRPKSVLPPSGEFYLAEVCTERNLREGARTYRWREKASRTVASPSGR